MPTTSVRPQRAYDAVVFDLLTALLDSWTLWNAVAGSAEQGIAWRRKYLELTYRTGAYRPYELLVREAAEASRAPPACAEALVARWQELKPWEEAGEVLGALAARAPLAIATNCSERLGRRAADCVGGRFSVIVTAEQAGYYKPRPEPYRAVLQRLGTSPERTLFVAGSAADVPGARGVGMPVYWHNRMRLPPIDGARPDFSEGTLHRLLDLV